MSSLWGTEIQGAVRVPVSCSGEWVPTPERRWKGTLTSTTEIVALTALRRGKTLDWAKSGSSSCSTPLSMGIGLYDLLGVDVQVWLSVGNGGARSRTTVPSATYAPDILDSQVIQTGRLVAFTRITGSPQIDLGLLLLARIDVKFRRNRIWHIRKELASGVDDTLARILSDGRSGTAEP